MSMASFIHASISPMLYVHFPDLIVTPGQEKAFKYFKKNSMSVEILKDDHLQKINFRVKNKVETFNRQHPIAINTIVAVPKVHIPCQQIQWYTKCI